MRHLIVGFGEVGQALFKIFPEASVVVDSESQSWFADKFHFIHICFPYSDMFSSFVEVYKDLGEIIIVHSTVPVGTCDKLGVIHSPIRGVHPNLEEGIRTFVKYFGGKYARRAASMFGQKGIVTRIYKYARTTEAIKLWDTAQYGRLIKLEKEIFEWCKKHNVNFDDIYRKANKEYNEGYIRLGRPEVVRPYLKHIDGPIGGHCIIPNAKLLGVKL